MQSEKKLDERVLDTNLLAGSIDVDDYATALLTQHSLEHANRELERLKKELEVLKKEKTELIEHVQNGEGIDSVGKAALDDSQKKRKQSAVSELHDPGHASGVDMWYSDVFSEELKVLSTVKRKVAEAEESLPSEREKALEDELLTIKRDYELAKDSVLALTEERDELADMRKALEAQLESLAQEREDLVGVKTRYELELHSLTDERDQLLQHSDDLEMQHRSLHELNKALVQKIDHLEDTVKAEASRSLRAYEYIFQLKRNSDRRRTLQEWKQMAIERKQMSISAEKAAAFHRKKVAHEVINAWSDYTVETAFEKGTQMKLKRRMLQFVIREWSRNTRSLTKSRRTAELFAKMKEAQALRQCFRSWRKAAHSLAVTTTSESIDLSSLRELAAKERVPAMMYAAERGMTKLVIELIKEGSPVYMKERTTGATPLHAAAESGCTSVVDILLEASADPAVTDVLGETPLQKLVRKGPDASVEVAKALLLHGADPSFVSPRDGRSILHLAVDFAANVELVSTLLQFRAAVNQQQASTGRTALHAAAAKGNFPILEVMVSYIRQSRNDFASQFPMDSDGRSPLHLAAISDSPDMPKCIALLLEVGFNVNAKSFTDETPLHLFCQNTSALPSGLAPIVQYDADLDAQDKHLNTPLHYACKANIRGVAVELVSKGASLYLVNSENDGALDLVAPAFAVILLKSIRIRPFLERCERAHRDMETCMICKNKVQTRRFLGRAAVHCRRCGRLCCADCAKHQAKLPWPAPSNPNAASTSPMSSSLKDIPQMVISEKEEKICDHCAKVLTDYPELSATAENV